MASILKYTAPFLYNIPFGSNRNHIPSIIPAKAKFDIKKEQNKRKNVFTLLHLKATKTMTTEQKIRKRAEEKSPRLGRKIIKEYIAPMVADKSSLILLGCICAITQDVKSKR